MQTNKTWKSVVFWSIISAAFIGPGTVTTAVSAGSQFKLDLLWSVTFATIACIVLQEVAARITIASGLNVGQALIKKFGRRYGRTLQWAIGGCVIGGCAAYEAGNILGAVAGMQLITGVDKNLLTVIVTAISFFFLWRGSPRWISNLMMFLVVVMGIAFITVAVRQDFSAIDVVKATVIPTIPPGSALLILGLVGTTVVPYNVFLGSGISKGQTIPLMRIGLIISIVIGGLITAAILVAGTAIRDFSSFQNLFLEFELKVGKGAAMALALGLFAAGFSSAITAPYASAVIARTVFEVKKENTARIVWISVLGIGFIFGISGVKPIPVILLVQALNGLILPFLVIFLIIVITDRDIIPVEFRHGTLHNILLLLTLGGVVMIGLNNIDTVLSPMLGLDSTGHWSLVLSLSFVVMALTGGMIFRKKSQRKPT